MFSLSDYRVERTEWINAELERLTAGIDTRLGAAMRHCLMAGGKRLRPILCLAAAEAVAGASDAAVLRAGCAIEMIHTYSLIHDDLPAMDDDAVRRGLPTCHVAFDEATAVLAGDALLSLAFEVLADLPTDPDPALRVIRRIAAAAGPAGMIEGQMRDMAAEGRQLDRNELSALHRLKTGAMIRVAVETGATLAGASKADREALDRYADRIGLAFQVTDDLLNVDGDPDRLGKAVGSDARRRKSTYPALMGLPAARRAARDLVTEAVSAIAGFDDQAEPLRAIAAYVIERNR